ncbi:hypothetical protein BC936DRAFT_137009 [Jimgerdemannia flammicorona]|uniref:Uncharacterized protein n=1 Tax=Jimgerdemannia flammicorona TaxID=994334 RepID=A0A433CYA2_9FUNG|nr:hypothetical protein BC936DRAFT_137009 [Jimgerdemannia flammicorona]
MTAPYSDEETDRFACNAGGTFNPSGIATAVSCQEMSMFNWWWSHVTTLNLQDDTCADAWDIRKTSGKHATASSRTFTPTPRWALQTDLERKDSETHVGRLESKLQGLLDRSRERYRSHPSMLTGTLTFFYVPTSRHRMLILSLLFTNASDHDSAIGSDYDDQGPVRYNPDENDEGLYLLWKAHIKRNRPLRSNNLESDNDDDTESSSSGTSSSESDDDEDYEEEAALEAARARRKVEGQYTWGWMWNLVSCCFNV